MLEIPKIMAARRPGPALSDAHSVGKRRFRATISAHYSGVPMQRGHLRAARLGGGGKLPYMRDAQSRRSHFSDGRKRGPMIPTETSESINRFSLLHLYGNTVTPHLRTGQDLCFPTFTDQSTAGLALSGINRATGRISRRYTSSIPKNPIIRGAP